MMLLERLHLQHDVLPMLLGFQEHMQESLFFSHANYQLVHVQLVILVLQVVLLEPVALVLEILLVYVAVVEVVVLSELEQPVFVQVGLKAELAYFLVLQFLLQDLPWLIVLICV
jgi:hypothetical protein